MPLSTSIPFPQLHLIFCQPLLLSMARITRHAIIRLDRPAPSLCTDIRSRANTNAPSTIIAPWAPRPACTARNRQVVEAEAEPSTDDTNHAAEENVEAKVAEVREPRADNVDCGADGEEHDDERIDGGSGVLVADGYDELVVV